MWLRYWSIARYDLGLSSAEFYDLTPRQLHALVDRLKEQRSDQELLNGIVTAAVVNYSMSAPKKPVSPADFMPSRAGERRQKPKQKTRRQVEQECRSIFGSIRAAQSAQAAQPQSQPQ